MADSRWVLDASATIARDVDLVVRWWFDPMRTTENRVKLERRVPAGFYWRTEDTSTLRIREFGWTVPGTCTVEHRRLVHVPPGQLPPRQEDGYLVSGDDFVRTRYLNGREVTTECRHTVSFRPVAMGMTQLRSVHEHVKKGGRWWERYLPPVTERSAFRREFAKLAGLCETDLGPGLQGLSG